MTEFMKRIHLRILGQVQGVGFRYGTEHAAKALGIKGWVRNLPGSEVETVAEGEDDAINEFIKYCNQGPHGAVVHNIKIEEEKYQNEFKDFEIKL
jgi:acylphosphatase